MSCEYCGGIFGHDSRCPNAPDMKTNYYCSICKEGIFRGEKYVVNDDDKYAHWECVDFATDLAKFFDIDIREMEEEDY